MKKHVSGFVFIGLLFLVTGHLLNADDHLKGMDDMGKKACDLTGGVIPTTTRVACPKPVYGDDRARGKNENEFLKQKSISAQDGTVLKPPFSFAPMPGGCFLVSELRPASEVFCK